MAKNADKEKEKETKNKLKKTEKQLKNEFLQKRGGYNPSQYRNMTLLFVILSIINIATVFLAFLRTGYGLYHAEDALSHIAKIAQCVQNVNEDALHIVIHNTDRRIIADDINSIETAFNMISSESEKYREINLDKIDTDLKIQFDDASQRVQRYQNALTEFTDGMVAATISADAISEVYASDIEYLKNDAESAMNAVFEYQSKATYDFFVRAAQQFLFVLLFLLITMTVGILGIRKMKRNARNAAETIVEEHEKSERSREKVINIAYTNILTGFKNRYGLEDDLGEKVKTERLTLAVFNYNQYTQVNERYGRSKADAFISIVSQKLLQQFGEEADIYSTDTDEFCFVFRNEMSASRTEHIVQQIAKTLSRPYEFSGVTVSLTTACCFYTCEPGKQQSFENLLCTLDRAISIAKQECKRTGENAVINVNKISEKK